jgi:hypothetical protein
MSIAIRSTPSQKIGKNVAKLHPMWGKGIPVFFRAENGLIVCVDNRDGTPGDRRRRVCSWQEMTDRIKAFRSMIIQPQEDSRWSFERRRATRFVEEMEEVIKEARTQGNPFETGPATGKNSGFTEYEMASIVSAQRTVRRVDGDRHLEQLGLTGGAVRLAMPRAKCDF